MVVRKNFPKILCLSLTLTRSLLWILKFICLFSSPPFWQSLLWFCCMHEWVYRIKSGKRSHNERLSKREKEKKSVCKYIRDNKQPTGNIVSIYECETVSLYFFVIYSHFICIWKSISVYHRTARYRKKREFAAHKSIKRIELLMGSVFTHQIPHWSIKRWSLFEQFMHMLIQVIGRRAHVYSVLQAHWLTLQIC